MIELELGELAVVVLKLALGEPLLPYVVGADGIYIVQFKRA